MATRGHSISTHSDTAKRNIYRKPFFEGAAHLRRKQKDNFFQPKLAVSAPGDKHEKEADAMADHVTRSISKNAEAVQRKCKQCEEDEKVQPKRKDVADISTAAKEDDEVTRKVQRQSVDDDREAMQKKDDEKDELSRKENTQNEAAPQSIVQHLMESKGGGSKLPSRTRDEMGSSFGADFSGVNIHSDTRSAEMNEELHAHAFTHGNDIYFNRGKFSPDSSSGKHLLAHELTHVVQQNSGLAKKSIQRQIVFGSGYSGFPDTGSEVRKAKDGKWNPTTIDFSTNAGRSGGGQGAKDLPELLALIAKQSKGSITTLGIIGHSNSRALGLSGDVHSQGVPLTGLITKATLDSNKAAIDAVKDRFAPGATITLYSCNSGGISNGLADVVSEAFGVCVKGFANDVLWCITWNESPLKVTSRGNVFYENPNDPLAGAGLHPSCSSFHKKVTDLHPDITSCKGKKSEEKKACIDLNDIPIVLAGNFVPSMFQDAEAFEARGGNVEGIVTTTSIGTVEGLKLGDGLVWGTWHLRSRVTRLQQLLGIHGHFTRPDGMFGPKTKFALNTFQSLHDITTGDVVDSRTADVLEGRSNNVCPPGKVPFLTA